MIEVLDDLLDVVLNAPLTEASVVLVLADKEKLLRASFMWSMASLDSFHLRARRSPTFSASKGSLQATLNILATQNAGLVLIDGPGRAIPRGTCLVIE